MSQDQALVIVAHPDDEALGFAGTIARLQEAGRAVRVAVVTNGDSEGRGRSPFSLSGGQWGGSARIARQGLWRNRETIEAMKLLGLPWAADPRSTRVFFLGYPNYSLETIAAAERPWHGDRAGLHHTYAANGRRGSGNGDLRYLLDGRHARLCAADMARDFDDLLELAAPRDVYSHAEFDGHPDHAEVHRQVVAAIERRGEPVTLHCTLIHPEGTRDRMYDSALEWPNPSEEGEASSPFERFRPDLDFAAPPVQGGADWGPLGQPDELVEVPAAMLDPDPATNLKWGVIAKHASQIRCEPDAPRQHHPSCGFMRAFVKRHEFFWEAQLRPIVTDFAGKSQRFLTGRIELVPGAARKIVLWLLLSGDSGG